ncbi:MAG: hypothetical protein IRY87_27975 [Acetobacteraceae bacterium]|nr:hypothetical protein [Acetobacteraceae bacterium]
MGSKILPKLHGDPEGQVYLEVFARQLSACAAIGTYRGDVLAPTGVSAEWAPAAARELLILCSRRSPTVR